MMRLLVMGIMFIGLFAATAKAQTEALDQAERASLRGAVAPCWNVGALTDQARGTVVIIAFDLDKTAKPIASSLRLLSTTAADGAGSDQAYATARRAILRCGAKGFKLPLAKYPQWKSIKMTFDPERTLLK